MPTQSSQKLANLTRFFFLGFLISCSFRDNSLKHFFSEPSFEKSSSRENTEQVLILSNSSLLGQLENTEEIYEGLPPIKIGGKDVITSYIDITREKYPNLLFLDAGNIFSEKALDKTIDFYYSLDIDAIALTDSDLIKLRNLDLKLKLPLLNSNFMDLKSGKNLQLTGLNSSFVFQKGKLNIAVYSLMDPKTYKNVVEGIYVKDPILSLLKEKKSLEKKEIDLNVLILSVNTECYSENPNEKKTFKNYDNFQLICPKGDPLFKFISRLPPNFIDLIVLNNEGFSDGFIGELPIMGNPGRGKYLGRMNINYDLTKKKIIKDKSEILPPLKTCHQFFASTEDCHLGAKDLSRNEQKRIDLILESGNKVTPAIYLGENLSIWTDSITN